MSFGRKPLKDPTDVEEAFAAQLSDLPFLISRIECEQLEKDDIDGMIDALVEIRKVHKRLDTALQTLKKDMMTWLESRRFEYYERETDGARVTRLEVQDVHFDAATLKLYLKESDYTNLRRTSTRKRLLVQTKEERIKASRVHKYV